MKTLYQKSPQQEQASVLLVALLFAVVIGITMSSYLYLISNQDQAVVRSQHWNAALDVAEAGIEEGLAQMNASPGDFSANGWGGANGVYGPVSRTLAGGSYRVSILTNPLPSVCSTGYMTMPITGSNVSRVVKVTAVSIPLFNVGLGAVGNIDMKGNDMATDSWNSYSTNLSNNGVYDPTKISTNGNVASVGGIVNIGNHTIDGNLYLGPTATYTSGTNQVMDKIYYDYNVQFPDAVLPAVSWPAAPVTGNGGNAKHDITSSGTWLVSDSLPIIVEAGITATLQVTTTSFSPSSITILGGMTNSGTLIMYQDSGTASLSGNAAAGGNRPENFYYYGLPGVTSITLGGTTAFIGAIYAPEASLTLNGGGGANNLQGSCIVKSVSMNGHYDFHYDESLVTYGPAKGYTVNSWPEF